MDGRHYRLTIAAKADYARERGLGGVMFWDLSADDEAASLATAAHEALTAPVAQTGS